MRALEGSDPGPTAFDERRRPIIFVDFVKDSTFGRAWLIFEAERPVGYVVLTLGFSFEYRGRDAFLDELYLEGKSRGRGIGRKAMEFVEGVARELGVNAVHLEVSRDNDAGPELYRQAGYADHDRCLMTKWLIREHP
jgi:GNAT superfamily N-acetyltransferase